MQYLKNAFLVLTGTLATVVLLHGCGHSAAVLDQPSRAHLWTELYTEGGEDPGYGMYTYVLTNRCISGGVSNDATARYERLIQEITESTLPVEEKSEFEEENYNLFLIPARTAGQTYSSLPDSLVSEYGSDRISKRQISLNDQLSMRLLNAIAITTQDEEFSQQISTSAGPFLISTVHPISASSSSEGLVNLLYVDLSNTNPAAMGEVVSAYKRRISYNEVEGVKRFRSTRLALLNVILNVDDSIKLVKVAAADVFDFDTVSDSLDSSQAKPIVNCYASR